MSFKVKPTLMAGIPMSLQVKSFYNILKGSSLYISAPLFSAHWPFKRIQSSTEPCHTSTESFHTFSGILTMNLSALLALYIPLVCTSICRVLHVCKYLSRFALGYLSLLTYVNNGCRLHMYFCSIVFSLQLHGRLSTILKFPLLLC